jgi:hypothetical protein
MQLNIGTKDPVNKVLWDESKARQGNGGWALADTLNSGITWLLKGAPINVDYDTRVANLVKSAAITGGDTTNPEIALLHSFKVGDVISDGVVALEIATITETTTKATLAFTAGTLSTATVGTVLYEAATAQTTAGGASAVATVEDTIGDFLIATADVSTSGANWNNVTLKIEQAADDNLAVAFAAGILTISLADTTPANNNVAAIQAAVDLLGTVEGYDLTELTFSGTDWDGNQTGATLNTPTDLFDGGVNQVAPASKFAPNGLLSENTKIVGTPTVGLVIQALDVDESNLPYPMTAAFKTSLGQLIKFV